MNENIIMGMVEPYLKNNTLTYREFEQIFSMLSSKEQQGALEVLDSNNVELVEIRKTAAGSESLTADETDDVELELLYDNDLFCEEGSDSEELKEGAAAQQTEFLKVRKKVSLSNRTLIKMIQEGDAQAKQDLCIANRGLVDKQVNIYIRFMRNNMEFEDLEQAGMIGMIKAAERFDLNMGTEFSTYAMWWIKQSIMREIMDHGYTVRIPVHRMEQIQRVMRLDAKFAGETDLNERVKLISVETGMPVVLVEDCIRLFYQFIGITSLDLPIGEEEDTTLGELVVRDNAASVEDTAYLNSLKENIREILDTLTDRERKVITLRYGLIDGRRRTLEEVGKEFSVTRERIRQIEAKALRKLRHPSRSKRIKDYLR